MSIVITGLVVLLCVGRIAAESGRGAVERSGMRWLEHGITYKGIAMLGIGMPVYVLVSNVLAGRVAMAGILGATFVVLGAPVFLAAFFWRVGYDHSGVYARSLWKGKRFVPWAEVTGVRFSNPMKQWIIQTKSQYTIRINELIPGATDLISRLEERGMRVG